MDKSSMISITHGLKVLPNNSTSKFGGFLKDLGQGF
jgi:hypothetical protein